MRYINKIPRTSEEELVGAWINDIGLVSKRILEQKNNFFYRSELQLRDFTKLILTLAEEATSTPSSLIFDIDVVSIKECSADWNVLSGEILQIHNEIREVFDKSQTEKYTQFLKCGA